MESSPVIKLLNEKFVSSWSLVIDLQAIAANSTDLDLKRKAKISLDTYKFPVHSMILDTEGNVLAKLNANDLLDSGNNPGAIFSLAAKKETEDPLSENYLKFLHKGLIAGSKQKAEL